MRRALYLCLSLQLCLAGQLCHTRRKRYLAFPDRSNLAITITLLKPTAFMNGVNTLHEIDLGVPLPRSPHRLLARREAGGDLQRRQLYGQIEAALDMYGLNGAGCLARAMCEVQRIRKVYLDSSIILKLLKSVFTLEGVDYIHKENCSDYCPVSIFHKSILYK